MVSYFGQYIVIRPNSNQSKELSSLLERSMRKTKENLESGIKEIVSAYLMFGDILCRNFGQVFVKTWVGNCPSCPPATYAPKQTLNQNGQLSPNVPTPLPCLASLGQLPVVLSSNKMEWNTSNAHPPLEIHYSHNQSAYPS